MIKKCFCEFIGTAVLVLFGCGVAVVSAGNLVATSLAFGLAIIALAYAIGNVSGCHVNPAVSLAMLINGKISILQFLGYIVSQIAGAFAGAGILYFILNSSSLVAQAGGIAKIGFGTNGFGDESTLGITLAAAFVVEVVLTFVFIYTILGVTSDEKKSSISGVVIGLTLAFVHLLGITLTGTSVNPARSLAPAVIMGGTALSQVWVFLVAPLCGAVIAALVYKLLNAPKKEAEE